MTPRIPPHPHGLAGLLLAALLALAPSTAAQLAELQKLLPQGGQAGDGFGAAVATDGALVVVGATHAGAAGAAYVFGASSGELVRSLEPSDGAVGDRFGAAVAVDGTRIAVSAPGADDAGEEAGAVYVFDAVSGNQLTKLFAGDALAGDQFGFALDLDGERLAVGALGSAYVFDASTGQQLEQLEPTGGSTTFGLSGFGEAIAIDGDRVVVGARLENGVSGISGAAYLFDASSGDQLHRMSATNGTVWAFFGACVAIDGDVVAIGAPEAGPQGKHSGAAYVFDASSGQQQHYLFPADGHVFAKFGSSVALDGTTLFVGSPQNHVGVQASAGSVYLYDADDGSPDGKLSAGDVQPNDDFGEAVAAAGGMLLAGAPGDDDLGSGSGSAYLFGDGTAWQLLGGSKPGSLGPPTLAGEGSLLGGEPMGLVVGNGAGGATAHLVLGLSELSAPFKGGTLVPQPDVILTPLPLDGAGRLLLLTAWPEGTPSGLPFFTQVWIEDPGATLGLSASNGLRGTTP